MPDQLISTDPNWGLTSTPPPSESSQSLAPVDRMLAAYKEQAQKDADLRANWAANLASRLPQSLQRPGGVALGLLEPAAQIASVLAASPTALAAARNVRDAAAPFADAFIQKKLGMDPDAMNLATTRLRLQAAKSATRTAQGEAKLAAQQEAQAAAEKAAASGVRPPSATRLVLSPQEVSAQQQLQQVAQQRASERGMMYAAGMKPGGTSLDQMRQLVTNGASPYAAAVKVSGGNQRSLQSLLMQWAQNQ